MNTLINYLGIYFCNVKALEGVVVPALASVAILLVKGRHLNHKRLIFLLLSLGISASVLLSRWGGGGLHVFSADLIFWPLMTMLFPDDFPWVMAYPAAFLSVLAPDIYCSGAFSTWRDSWFFGIGGSGFYDGDFIAPALTVAAAFTIHLCQKRGLFAFRTYQAI